MENTIQFFCPRWGSEQLPWKDFMLKAKKAGYGGIEFGVPREMSHEDLMQIWKLAGKHDMLLIPQQYDTYEADFTTHKQAFSKWFEKIKPFAPLFINTQTGKDFFSMQENEALFRIADEYSHQTGVPVYHETHRSKCLFAAHIARQYFNALPALRITLDMSHWVCVAESLLDDQSETMRLACHHTEHIHARVGYVEGPQVTDPLLPQWEKELAAHLRWWDVIVEQRRREQKPVTITTEFGAYPYMVHLPDSGEPIVNQWDVNLNVMKLLKNRYDVKA